MPSFPSATIFPVERLDIPASLLLDGTSDDDDDLVVSMNAPPSLRRTSSIYLGKRILSFAVDNSEESRVWLHRKVRSTSTDGTVRLGYLLQPSSNSRNDDENNDILTWKVATDDDTVQMVEVRIEDKNTKGLEEEFAVLQWIATQRSNPHDGLHVKQVLLGADAKHLYCLQPHEPSCMSLAAHMGGGCSNSSDQWKVMPVQEAKRYFRNIVRGLETMTCMGIYHGCINTETLVVVKSKSGSIDVYDCLISELGACRQIEESAATNGVHASLQQIPQFVPPEVWSGSTVASGSDLDLWAAGVVLYSLTVSEPFFTAPVPSDPVFAAIQAAGDSNGAASMDLVQRMLRSDPKERLTLQQVKDHPWLREQS